jgi:hypothetical protein
MRRLPFGSLDAAFQNDALGHNTVKLVTITGNRADFAPVPRNGTTQIKPSQPSYL